MTEIGEQTGQRGSSTTAEVAAECGSWAACWSGAAADVFLAEAAATTEMFPSLPNISAGFIFRGGKLARCTFEWMPAEQVERPNDAELAASADDSLALALLLSDARDSALRQAQLLARLRRIPCTRSAGQPLQIHRRAGQHRRLRDSLGDPLDQVVVPVTAI